jgi:hypothetical protein
MTSSDRFVSDRREPGSHGLVITPRRNSAMNSCFE